MHDRVVRAVAVAMMLAGVSRAQAPAPGPTGVATDGGVATVGGAATVVGFMHAIHATNVLEKTLGFYTEVFGLSGQIRPFANEAVPILTDSPGVSLRVSMLSLPLPGQGFNFELTEFSNVARTPAQPQIWDPGAPHMKILVRDLAPVVAAIRKLGAPIMTTSGAPVAVSTPLGPVKAIMFRDPDGYMILLARMKANGVRVVSRNGELVNWSPTVRNVFVKDPGGLNIELVGNVPAAK